MKLISDEMLALGKIDVIELVQDRIVDLELQCDELKSKSERASDSRTSKMYVISYMDVKEMVLFNKKLLCTIKGEVFEGGVQ